MKQASKNTMFGQGDVIFVPADKVPEGCTEATRENGLLICTHSETGHHHAIDSDDARLFNDPKDPLVAYLSVEGSGVELVHHRSVDTHEPIFFPPGIWKVHRQVEYSPGGWRRVED